MAALINSDTARSIIRQKYGKSKNLLADRIMGYTMTHYGSNRAVEISKASFLGRIFYALSVVDYDPDTESVTARGDLVLSSDVFDTMDDAKRYIFSTLADLA